MSNEGFCVALSERRSAQPRHMCIPPSGEGIIPHFVRCWLAGVGVEGMRTMRCFQAASLLTRAGFEPQAVTAMILNSKLPKPGSERKALQAVRSGIAKAFAR